MIHPAIALFLLVLLIAMCLVGLWHQQFDDNLGQCFGMVIIILWAVATVAKVVAVRYMVPEDAFLCVGLLLYGSGSAVRTWLYKRKGPTHELDA